MAKKRKRRRKMSISSALIRFLIGMLLIAAIAFAGYYLLFEVDYSGHLINSDGSYASTRAYVLPADGSTASPEAEVTTPAPTSDPTAEPTATPEPTATLAPTETPLIGIATFEPTATPDATPEAEITAEPTEAAPTATPVPTPVPTPSPVPTPEPDGTRIPEDSFSSYRDDLKTPRAYEGDALRMGLSRCYTSRLNLYQVMQINGWGYFDVPEYDGLTATTYLLVTPVGANEGRIYLCSNREGASRRIHDAEFADNVACADFEVTIDTSSYASGEYQVQLILQYIAEDENYVYLCPFAEPRTFTVIDGEIITTPALD